MCSHDSPTSVFATIVPLQCAATIVPLQCAATIVPLSVHHDSPASVCSHDSPTILCNQDPASVCGHDVSLQCAATISHLSVRHDSPTSEFAIVPLECASSPTTPTTRGYSDVLPASITPPAAVPQRFWPDFLLQRSETSLLLGDRRHSSLSSQSPPPYVSPCCSGLHHPRPQHPLSYCSAACTKTLGYPGTIQVGFFLLPPCLRPRCTSTQP